MSAQFWLLISCQSLNNHSADNYSSRAPVKLWRACKRRQDKSQAEGVQNSLIPKIRLWGFLAFLVRRSEGGLCFRLGMTKGDKKAGAKVKQDRNSRLQLKN